MLYTDKEQKMIRLGLNTGAIGNEVENAATALFRSLKERGVSADAVITGNGQAPDMARVLRLESELRTAQANYRFAIRENEQLQVSLRAEKNRNSETYSRGYNEGFTNGRNQSERHERYESRSESTERESKRSTGRSTGRTEFVPNEEQKAKKAQWEKIAKEYDGESEDFVLEFGKCRGQKLAIASLNWLEWAVRNIHDMPYTIEIIVDYLDQLKRNSR